jgi:hypothetical protein
MKRLVVMFVLAFALSTVAVPKVRVDFDHAADFSCYKTYRWAGAPNADFLNQLMQKRVIGFVEEALAAKGLKRVETGGDLVINFQMDVMEQPVYTTISNGGWDWGWGGGIATTTTQIFLTGMLTVDVVDSRKGRLVFQGRSTSPISSKPTHNTRRLARSVNDIFEKYPPK